MVYCYAFLFFIPFFLLNATDKKPVVFSHLFKDHIMGAITSTLEDSEGLLWIGTLNGVYVYNGVGLVHYPQSIRSPEGVNDSHIFKIFEDSTGSIWIASRNGISKYNRDTDSFIQYYHEPGNYHSLPPGEISDIIEASPGKLWLAGEWLCLFDTQKETFSPFWMENDERVATVFLFIDKEDLLWVGTRNDLYVLNEDSEELQCVFKTGEHVPTRGDLWSFRSSIVQSDDGVYWITLAGKGLLSFKYDGEIIDLKGYNDSSRISTKIKQARLTSLHLTRQGDLWIGSENEGLFNYDPELKKFSHYKPDAGDEFSIGENSVWSIYEDSVGRMWFGTFTSGYSIIDPYYEKFKLIRDQLPYGNVAAIVVDRDENVWFGTDGGGLVFWDKENDSYSYYKNDPADSTSLISDAVISLNQDDFGNIWVGTWNGGISLLKKGEKSFTNFHSSNSILTSNDIYAINSDKKGNIFFGTYGGGLYIYNIFSHKWKRFYYEKNNTASLGGDRIFSLTFDMDSNLWIGYQRSGIEMLSWDENEQAILKPYRNDPLLVASLGSNYVNTMAIDGDGVLWIGTNNGLSRMDSNEDSVAFTAFFQEDGLSNNRVMGLLYDGKGSLWISTLDGISSYHKTTGTIRNFSSSDGLQGKQFNRNAMGVSSSGTLYFGGTKGVSYFNPDSLAFNPYPPKVRFIGLKIFNKPVSIGNGSPLKRHISQTEVLVLNHKHSVFSIEFAALNYTRPEKNQYAFKLEGLEEDWNYVGGVNIATYTTLDPGKYVFKVIAANNDGLWNEEGASIQIIVLPPLWRTWWFRLGILTLLVLLLFYLYKRRLIYLQRQRERLKALVDKRTVELSHVNEELEESLQAISKQKETLSSQYLALADVNALLEEQKRFITHQKKELEEHRNNLEIMVQKRTLDLAVALKKAEESDRLKSSFLSNMSHEIRTPMNAIIGFSELLGMQDVTAEQHHEYLSIIRTNGNHLLSLISDILDFSQIETGQVRIVKTSFKVSPFVEEVFNQFCEKGILRTEKDIALLLDSNLAPEDAIVTDQFRLRQILYNLINNAMKFTENGQIVVGVRNFQHHYLFFVKDSGIGISKENKNRLFRRFQQILTPDYRKQTGTGLGLVITRELLSLMGGRIWVHSQEDRGSIFRFTLPKL